MTDVLKVTKKSEKKKTVAKPAKSDETLLKDAKERIMRLQVCIQFALVRSYSFQNLYERSISVIIFFTFFHLIFICILEKKQGKACAKGKRFC